MIRVYTIAVHPAIFKRSQFIWTIKPKCLGRNKESILDVILYLNSSDLM